MLRRRTRSSEPGFFSRVSARLCRPVRHAAQWMCGVTVGHTRGVLEPRCDLCDAWLSEYSEEPDLTVGFDVWLNQEMAWVPPALPAAPTPQMRVPVQVVQKPEWVPGAAYAMA